LAAAAFAVVGGAAVYAQDKYTLRSPSGIAFSDFKGYEDWAVFGERAHSPEVQKRFRAALKCGMQTREAEIDFARLLDDLAED
jgi:hypothetical protein